MWSFVGETDKWVTVSESRFRGVEMTLTGAEVTTVGSAGEEISVAFADPFGTVSSVVCVFDSRESLVVSSSGGCV